MPNSRREITRPPLYLEARQGRRGCCECDLSEISVEELLEELLSILRIAVTIGPLLARVMLRQRSRNMRRPVHYATLR
jgi:hypothetical protein